MTSSLKRRSLSKPQRDTKIHPFDLGHVRTRNKNKAHSLLLELFKESGLSKAEIAKMLDKKPEQITRWLGGPGNLTLDTLSDFIFAMKGDFFVVDCKDELSRAKSNRHSPDWIIQSLSAPKRAYSLNSKDDFEQSEPTTSKTQYAVTSSTRSSQKEHQYGRYQTTTKRTIHAIP